MSKRSTGVPRAIQVRDIRNNRTVTYSSLAETSRKTGVGLIQLCEHLRKPNASKRTWNWLVFRYADKATQPWPDLEPALAIEHSFSLKRVQLYVIEHDVKGHVVKKIVPWLEDVNRYLGLKPGNTVNKIIKPRTKLVNGIQYRLRVASPEELIANSDILSRASKERSTRLRASYTRGSAESGGFEIEETEVKGTDVDRYRTNDTFNILTQLGRASPSV